MDNQDLQHSVATIAETLTTINEISLRFPGLCGL
jgi:hypothetical protein